MLCVLILALDTSDARGGVALLRDASVLHTEPHTTAEDYSSWLLPAVARTLTAVNLTMPEVDLYAVAAGPGSFTGVRVGLTTVKAWSEVYSRPIAAVSRLEALAAEGTGSAPYIAAFIDARRDQIFAGLYRRQGEMLEFIESCIVKAGSAHIDWVSTDPHCLTRIQQWASRPGQNETVQQISPLLAPRIGQIGYRLARQNQLTDAVILDANYVRRSDAELFSKGSSPHGARK